MYLVMMKMGNETVVYGSYEFEVEAEFVADSLTDVNIEAWVVY